MQVATQPSPLMAGFSRADIESAALAVIQHLIAESALNDAYEQNSCQRIINSSRLPVTAVIKSPVPNVTAQSNYRQKPVRTQTDRIPLPIVSSLVEMGFTRKRVETAIRNLGKLFTMLY